MVLQGLGPEEAVGAIVSGPSDANGDGLADIVLSAPTAPVNSQRLSGQTYVVYGRQQ